MGDESRSTALEEEVERLAAENEVLLQRLQTLSRSRSDVDHRELLLEKDRLKQKVLELELELLVKEEQVEYLYRNLVLSRRQLQTPSSLSLHPVKLELHRLQSQIIRQAGCTCFSKIPTPPTPTQRLPAEIWLTIFQFLAIPSIAAAASTCKRWHLYCQNLSFRTYWQRAYKAIWLEGRPAGNPDLAILPEKKGAAGHTGRGVDWRAKVAARFPVERNWRSSNPVVYTLQGHQGTVTCLHYVGETLVTGSDDGSMICWSLQNGPLSPSSRMSIMQQHHKQTRSNRTVRKHSLSGHGGPVWCCFSDGGQVVSGKPTSVLR